MADPLYVIAGASGQIGSALTRHLIEAGKRVRVLGREARRLKRLGAAESAIGSLEDGMYLNKALAGAAAVFVMLPPHLASGDYLAYGRRVTDAFVHAIAASGATQVVTLSSLGAELPEGTGPIRALRYLEQQLSTVPGISQLVLRPCYFFENWYATIPLLKAKGIFGSPLEPGLSTPMIATRDIAQVAARRLQNLEVTGHEVLELHGAKAYTMTTVATTLGHEIGRPDLPYVQFPYADARAGMIGMGISSTVADLFIEMYQTFNEGRIRPTQPRSSATTTPTTLGQFAKSFAAALKASPG